MKKQKSYLLILSILALNLALLLLAQRCAKPHDATQRQQIQASAAVPCPADELVLEEWGFTPTWQAQTPNPNFYYTFDADERVISLIIPSTFMLADFPKNLGCLNALERLKIQGQKGLVLPESIGFLEVLEELYLEDNAIKSVPINLGKLRNLRYLSLKKNLLTDLPNLKGLQNLKVLILSDNLFSDEKLAKIMSQLKPSVRLMVHGD